MSDELRAAIRAEVEEEYADIYQKAFDVQQTHLARAHEAESAWRAKFPQETHWLYQMLTEFGESHTYDWGSLQNETDINKLLEYDKVTEFYNWLRGRIKVANDFEELMKTVQENETVSKAWGNFLMSLRLCGYDQTGGE